MREKSPLFNYWTKTLFNKWQKYMLTKAKLDDKIVIVKGWTMGIEEKTNDLDNRLKKVPNISKVAKEDGRIESYIKQISSDGSIV